MIDALVSGRLYGKPTGRTAKNGARYVTCKLRVAMRDGETLFANIISFQAHAVTVLVALDDGDAIAVAGELTAKVWIDKEGKPRPGLDVVAHACLSPYSVARKRRAVSGAAAADLPETPPDPDAPPAASKQQSAAPRAAAHSTSEELDDELPPSNVEALAA